MKAKITSDMISSRRKWVINSLWFAPIILLGAFILASLSILWLIQTSTYKAKQDQLIDNAESTAESIRLHLKGNQDYLLLLAEERSDGVMNAQSFQERASRYIENHPEMIAINWVDENYIITDVAPFTSNKQIVGLQLNLPEPKRASRLAMETRQPVYTHPFVVIQGELAFELWVPVYHDDVFLGLFGGIYSYEKMLQSLVSPQVLKANNVSVVDASGNVLFELPPIGTVEEKLAHQVSIISPENGGLLQFKRYGSGALEQSLLLLELLCLAFAIGIVYAMWRLKRELETNKQTEEALRESESRFRGLFEDSPVSLWEEDFSAVKVRLDKLRQSGVTDFKEYFTDHPEVISECAALIKVLDVNKATVNLMKAGKKEDLLSNLIDHLKGDPIQGFADELVEIANGKTEFEWEGTNRTLDGDLIDVNLKWSVGPSHVKNLSRVIISIVDITERKQAEEKLYASEERFRSLFENAPLGVLLADTLGNIIEVNPAALHILGSPSAEATRKINILTFQPLIAAGISADFAECVRTAQSLSSEHPYITKWSKSIYMNMRFTPLVEAQGQTVLLQILLEDITERKQAETALLESEKRFRSLIEQSTDGVVLIDEQGLIIEWNTAEAHITGIPQAHALGAPFWDIQHQIMIPERRAKLDREYLKKSFFESFQTGRSERLGKPLDVEIVSVTGEHKFIQQTSFIIKTEKGNRVGAIVRDVTDRKHVEETLHQASQYNRRLIESSLDPLVTIGPDGKITDVNSSTEQVTGYKREELIGTDFSNYFTEPEKAQAGYQQVFLNGSVRDYPLEIRNRNGHITSVLYNASVYNDDKGNVVGVFAAARDVTARLQAQKALLASEARSRAIVNAVPDMLFEIDRNGAILDYSAPDELELYEPLDTFLGRQVQDILPQHMNQIALEKLEEALRTKKMTFFEYDMPILGSQRFYEVRNVALTESSILSVVRDITERKRAEGLVHQYASDLEQRVQERTLELVQANRAKDEFLANMSHELRTPLNGILGFSETLLEGVRGPMNERQEQAVEMIYSSGEHLLGLINDILDVSKIESGKFELRTEAIQVDEICRASLVFIKQLANKKSITVDYSSSPAASIISADPKRLKQILVNLLNNAVKFTPERGTVKLKAKADVRAGLIRFSVTDTGIGITSEDMQKLFKPFVQVDSSLSRQYEGTGLGLTLVKKLVEMHGGSIEVRSEVSVGSCFTFSLPWNQKLEDNDGGDAHSSESEIQAERTGMESTGHGKVLIADDNEANVMIVRSYLEIRGYEVFVANDGGEVFSKAEEVSPDIILMDLQMPKVNGFEATRRLRTDPRFVSTPIIAITAFAMSGDRERCLEAGMNEYISKPIKLKKLTQMIETFLNHFHR